MDCTEPTEPAERMPAAPRCTVAPLALAGCERRRYMGVAQPFAAHAHSHYVVGIVREGRRRLVCNGSGYELAPGDVIVFNPGDVHGCVQDGDGLFAYDSLAIPAAAFDDAPLTGPVFEGPDVRAALERLMRAAEDASGEDGVKAAARSFRHALIAGAPPATKPPTPGRNRPAALRTYGHLRKHIACPDPVGELARREELSPYALIRAYKREFSITPAQHLLSLRVDAARDLLARGASPAEAAAQAGFSDQAHLTRAFKQRIGSTPAAYRSMVLDAAPR